MSKQRGRLDPGEVKRAMAEEQREATPKEPFHSPFAAARSQLEKVVPPSKKPTAADRLRLRAGSKREEPSELAKVRAQHKASREALARSVQPVRRAAARPPINKDDGKDDGDHHDD